MKASIENSLVVGLEFESSPGVMHPDWAHGDEGLLFYGAFKGAQRAALRQTFRARDTASHFVLNSILGKVFNASREAEEGCRSWDERTAKFAEFSDSVKFYKEVNGGAGGFRCEGDYVGDWATRTLWG